LYHLHLNDIEEREKSKVDRSSRRERTSTVSIFAQKWTYITKRVYVPLSKSEKASLNYEERSKGEAGRNESVVTRGEGGRGRGIGAYFGDLRFRLQRRQTRSRSVGACKMERDEVE